MPAKREYESSQAPQAMERVFGSRGEVFVRQEMCVPESSCGKRCAAGMTSGPGDFRVPGGRGAQTGGAGWSVVLRNSSVQR